MPLSDAATRRARRRDVDQFAQPEQPDAPPVSEAFLHDGRQHDPVDEDLQTRTDEERAESEV